MRAAGLDIGSRTVEFIVLENDAIVQGARFDTTPSLEGDTRRLLSAASFDRLIVTGYGRTLAEIKFGSKTVTEIKAFARGAFAVCPECRTILDIGGQDTKVIALGEGGKVLAFEMNDRCAAGAGKFLEMMAKALDCDWEEFDQAALSGEETVRLSSMCAVFIESEVVGLLTKGKSRNDIARAVLLAIARRSATMLRRISARPPILFAGGAARSKALARFLETELGLPVLVPENPHAVGALGAALLARELPDAAPSGEFPRTFRTPE